MKDDEGNMGQPSYHELALNIPIKFRSSIFQMEFKYLVQNFWMPIFAQATVSEYGTCKYDNKQVLILDNSFLFSVSYYITKNN